MMPWAISIRITVQRGTPDRFNDTVYADHHQIDNCIDYPTGAGEQGLSNTHVTDYRELLCPFESDILATDRVLIHPAGMATVPSNDPARKTNTYQVVGPAKDWQNPFTGWAPGTQVSLERIT